MNSGSEGEGGGKTARGFDALASVDGFFHLLRDPAASQRIEKKWAELRRKRKATLSSSLRNLRCEGWGAKGCR